MFRYSSLHERLPMMKSKPHLGKMTPFVLFGHTYFIGTYQASSHLIDTGEGLIMIDTGYAKTAYLVLDSIYRLGFSPKDVKYIINTHWHGDHTEATAGFADLSGAKTLIGRHDAEKARRFFEPDVLVDDGDTLTLGNISVRFMHTPGHTKGTVSLFYDDTDGERVCRVGTFGGAGLNTLSSPSQFDFDGCREAYFSSLERLRSESVDVFIGNHTWNNDTYGKYLRLAQGERDAFVDPTLWDRFLDDCGVRLQGIVEREESKG